MSRRDAEHDRNAYRYVASLSAIRNIYAGYAISRHYATLSMPFLRACTLRLLRLHAVTTLLLQALRWRDMRRCWRLSAMRDGAAIRAMRRAIMLAR